MKKLLLLGLLALGTVSLGMAQTEMLGPLTREDILQGNPDWEAVAAAYAPQEDALESLRAVALPVHIEVFLGTWCPDSKAHVSELFKILDLAGSPLLQVSYVGVPRRKEAREPYIAGRDIQKIPTFIVNVDGREKGRIIEVPAKTLEQDLAEILDR